MTDAPSDPEDHGDSDGGEEDTEGREDGSTPDIIYECPNMFDEEAFAAWREECPDEYLWDDYEHLRRMRLRRDQLVEETVLSEREAEVVILQMEEYGYEAIAAQIDVAPSTAAEYAYRAREKVLEASRTIQLLDGEDEEWLADVVEEVDVELS